MDDDKGKLGLAKTILFMRALYFTVWAGKFIGQQYMAIFLKSFPFINDFLVGMIMSLGYLVTTGSQLAWGNIADHSRTKNTILNIAIIGFSVGLLLLVTPSHSSLGTLLASAFLFYVFISIPGLMADSIVVENSAKMGISFGVVKCFSSAGAGVIAFSMFLLSLRIEVKPVTGFVMALVTSVLALAPAHFLPPTKGHAWVEKKAKGSRAVAGSDATASAASAASAASGDAAAASAATDSAAAGNAQAASASVPSASASAAAASAPPDAASANRAHHHALRAILQNRRLTLLLVYILLLFIGIQATNVFMGIYYSSEEGMNAGLGMYGLFYSICIALETGLMLYGNRLINAVPIRFIFTLVGFAACLRSLIIFLAPNIYIMQFSAFGHMLIFAPLWTRLAPYVNDIVPMEMQATGQAAWYVMAFGLGPMAGAALGGVVADSLGIRNLFLVTATLLFVVTSVFTFLFYLQHHRADD
jgi:predicted MFS family arabinose efflux permease